jgi:hypothetical protein
MDYHIGNAIGMAASHGINKGASGIPLVSRVQTHKSTFEQRIQTK